MSGITETSATHSTNELLDKGKGKAVEPAEESEGESSGDEMDVADDDEEDELAEIDSSNILPNGRRTRGKQIDFAKAAAEQPAPEDDSGDDEDFHAADDGDKTDHEMQ